MTFYVFISHASDYLFLNLGTVFMPPKWSLGYHQCRWSYDSEAKVREVYASCFFFLSSVHLFVMFCYFFGGEGGDRWWEGLGVGDF